MSPSTLAFALSVGALVSTSPSFADQPQTVSAPVAAVQVSGARLPAPATVVSFTQLPRRFEDATIEIALTVDESGVPHEIMPVRPMPADLAERVLPTLSQWTFTPALDASGTPVAKRVILPLHLVAKD